MSRAAQNQATQTYNQANQLATGSTQNSADLYNQLVPTYTQEATNPQGYGASDLASMNTAAQQLAGGAMGSAVGEAGRMAAANRNSGSFAPVLDEASRDAGRTLSSDALNIQNKNAALKQQQRQQGISGLQNLDTQQNADTLGSIGLENSSTNTLVNAGNSGWFQNMISFINAMKAGGGGGTSTPSGSTDPGSTDDEIAAVDALGAF